MIFILVALFFHFSTERSSPGRKSATLEHCNCQQESGTSDRGNTVFIEILFGSLEWLCWETSYHVFEIEDS